MATNQNNRINAILVEKRGTWQFCLSYYEETRKRRQKWINTQLPIRGNKRAAEAMRDDILGEWEPKLLKIDRSEQDNACNNASIDSSDDKKILFVDYMQSWLDSVKDGLQVTTYSEYKRIFDANIYPYFQPKGIYLEDLKPSHIKEYYSFLGKTLSPNSILRQHANIRKALQTAVEDEDINLLINPADRVKRPQKVKYVSVVYSKEDLHKLFLVIGMDPLFLAILLDSTYGLRRSELVGLRWDSIDFQKKTITIKSSAVQCRVDGKYTTVVKPVLKNKSSYRSFPLTEQVEVALLIERDRQKLNMQKYQSEYNMDYSHLVFVNAFGELFKPNYVTKHFKLILEKHNLKKIRFHDIRHTCATLLLDGGMSVKDIQLYMGHSVASTTLDFYMHRDFTHQIKTTDVLGQIIREIS